MNALLEFLSTWMPVLLRTSIQAAVLVAVILAVQWTFGRRLSPAWRHALWGLVVVRLLLIWAPASPLSVYNLAVREVPVVAMEAPAEHMHTEIVAVPTEPMPGEAALARQLRDSSDISDGRESRTWGSYVNGVDFGAAASLVWLGVFGALLFAMAGQSLHFGRQVRRGRIVTDSDTLKLLEECRATLRVSPFLALVETDCVRSPALLGCIRPKLLLPCGFLDALAREEMRHVFLHELAHVKRGDIWSGWLFNLLLAAHWFNPAIWFARRRFIADREAACDAHVLAALDAAGQRDYGHTVLNLTQRFHASPWTPGMAGISETSSNLKRRITMIKQFRPPTRLAAWSGAGLCVCIGLATLTNAQDVKPANGDILCAPSDIYGYTATNGGTMIAAQLTNAGPQDVTVDVEFWEGGIDTGVKIGRGGLVVPAGKTATEAIPWAVENGTHTISVSIDPDNTVVESDEKNNRAEVRVEYTNGRFRQVLPETYAVQVETSAADDIRTTLAAIEELQKDPLSTINEFGIESKVKVHPRIVALEQDLTMRDVKLAELRKLHTEKHPEVKGGLVRIEVLRAALDKLAGEIRANELARLHSELTEQLTMKLDATATKPAPESPLPPQSKLPANTSEEVDCADNLKQLGIYLKKFATENNGLFPPLSPKPGVLMYAWGGDTPDLPGGPVLSSQISKDIPLMTGCPASDGVRSYGQPFPNDYVYLGYLVQNDRDVQNFSEAYTDYFQTEEYSVKPFSGNLPFWRNRIIRLHNGVERFLITDINNPAGGTAALSRVPLLIEWPKHHTLAPGKHGGNVLFMDGHVEFLTYPGTWPMTEETIGILCKLAGREPINKLE